MPPEGKAIAGCVLAGFGEGAFYVKKYAPYFKEKLGIGPFPGTLNIKVEKPPGMANPVRIEPGAGMMPVNCYRARVRAKGREVEAAIVVPEKSKHPKEIIEIISSANLRQELGLKDGDIVTCFLE